MAWPMCASELIHSVQTFLSQSIHFIIKFSWWSSHKVRFKSASCLSDCAWMTSESRQFLIRLSLLIAFLQFGQRLSCRMARRKHREHQVFEQW